MDFIRFVRRWNPRKWKLLSTKFRNQQRHGCPIWCSGVKFICFVLIWVLYDWNVFKFSFEHTHVEPLTFPLFFFFFFNVHNLEMILLQHLQVKNPQRDLPIGIGIALSLCCILYMLVSAVIVGLVPYYALDPDTPISSAFAHYGMEWAA